MIISCNIDVMQCLLLMQHGCIGNLFLKPFCFLSIHKFWHSSLISTTRQYHAFFIYINWVILVQRCVPQLHNERHDRLVWQLGQLRGAHPWDRLRGERCCRPREAPPSIIAKLDFLVAFGNWRIPFGLFSDPRSVVQWTIFKGTAKRDFAFNF